MHQDDLTKMTVVLALLECNATIMEATTGFTNPDSLLDLPEELRIAFQDVLSTATVLAEKCQAHLERQIG